MGFLCSDTKGEVTMSDTFTIGGRAFDVTKLPIRVVKDLARCIDMPTGTSELLLEKLSRCVTIVVRHSDQSLTDENVEAMTATAQELDDAYGKIMRFHGFITDPAEPEAAPAPSAEAQIA